MKRFCVTLILLFMLGGSTYKAEHLTPNGLIAEQLLIHSQGYDPDPYIGKSVDIEKFIIKNHTLVLY